MAHSRDPRKPPYSTIVICIYKLASISVQARLLPGREPRATNSRLQRLHGHEKCFRTNMISLSLNHAEHVSGQDKDTYLDLLHSTVIHPFDPGDARLGRLPAFKPNKREGE